ncbi:TIGR00366 family protein [Butyricicoccus faecihominis]|uniref:YfcC family protein n=1 Tax=Butyricicoccus faecihominis TaxID=1712515 RepID=UPI00247AFA5A|nr:Na+/H+ antiporter NhaC family protein [Butyricicoccus faecihominis]MCQ5130947.1 TIGR00366 family protein [Butyricicoccus faecihominis]
MKESNTKAKKRLRMPHVLALLVIMILIATVATWFIPAGQFDREINEAGRSVVVAGSYHTVESNPASLWDAFGSIIAGLIASAQIVFTVFIIGGAFHVLQSADIVQAFLGKIVRVFRKRDWLLICLVMVLLSTMCTFIGLFELSLVIIPIMIPVCLALGLDSMTAVGLTLVSSVCGFAVGITNPFTVVVAQGIGQMPLYSGTWFRAICLVLFTAAGVIYVLRYSRKIKRAPQSSIMYDRDQAYIRTMGLNEEHPMTRRKMWAGIAFVVCFLVLVFGALKWSWGLNEIATIFVIASILVGFISGMSVDSLCQSFIKGLETFVLAAFAVGFARGITVVLEQGLIIDTIVNSLATLIANVPSQISAVTMMFVQLFFNFLVPSGSGQATIMMPIMLPLSDLVGITRQTAIIAFQFGDGFSNILWPTMGALWACIGAAKIKFNEWVRWLLPLIVIWYAMGAVVVFVAQSISLA